MIIDSNIQDIIEIVRRKAMKYISDEPDETIASRIEEAVIEIPEKIATISNDSLVINSAQTSLAKLYIALTVVLNIVREVASQIPGAQRVSIGTLAVAQNPKNTVDKEIEKHTQKLKELKKRLLGLGIVVKY
jgi:thiamine biosynthesis lipoprotein ApbE